jgi:hypothetical protein
MESPVKLSLLAAGGAALLATIAVAQSAPDSSARAKGWPDVMGMRPGQMSLAQVQALLASHTPALVVTPHDVALVGQSTAAGIPRQIDIPGAKHTGYLTAVSADRARYLNPCSMGSLATASCEQIDAVFSGPPAAGVLLSVRRLTVFAQGTAPTVENTMAALTTKYGKPGFYRDYNNRGVEFNVAWAWTQNGQLIPMTEDHPCASAKGAVFVQSDSPSYVAANIEQSDTQVKAGCVVVVHATFHATNGVLRDLTLMEAAPLTANRAAKNSQRYATDFVSQQQNGERDKAAKVKDIPL